MLHFSALVKLSVEADFFFFFSFPGGQIKLLFSIKENKTILLQIDNIFKNSASSI